MDNVLSVFQNLPWPAVVAVIVAIASFAANFVGTDSVLGKLVHWLALNGANIQAAIAKRNEEKRLVLADAAKGKILSNITK